jgi:hypothetical protein
MAVYGGPRHGVFPKEIERLACIEATAPLGATPGAR